MFGVEGGRLGIDGVDSACLVECRFGLISWDFSVLYAGTNFGRLGPLQARDGNVTP